MNRIIKLSFSTLLGLSCLVSLIGQPAIHSHNDYFQRFPLITAISSGATSIEIDVIYKDAQLLVAHDERGLPNAKTIKDLYLDPIASLYKLHPEKFTNIQFMVDIKNEPLKSLQTLVNLINETPELKVMLDAKKIKPFVISGSRPASYKEWPEYILFDHQSLDLNENTPLDKIAFFSFSFKNFSQWNGKGRLTTEDEGKIKEVIQKVQMKGKKIRFWATPDTKSAWYTLYHLEADYINTDQPFKCQSYVAAMHKNFLQREAQNKAQGNFIISESKIKKPAKNIILMIGDGNGLAHITSAYAVKNGQIHIATAKNVGLIHTHSYDDLITDSAAGGTALACGQKTRNRHLGVNPNGEKIDNIFEKLPPVFTKAILTTDEVTGATPSAFYAHVKERDDTEAITNHLLSSDVDLIVGSGKKHFKNVSAEGKARIHSDLPSKILTNEVNIVAYENDDLPFKSKGRGDFLTEKFTAIMNQLDVNNKPFFFVVENSHIDAAGHYNNANDILEEVLDFDKCVGKAIEFIKKNPNTTLIVLSDHETGGITIPHGNADQINLSFSTDDHSGSAVPVFAWGKHAEIFGGMYQNTNIYHKILHILGIK
jgi:alkaline phosphatase